MRATFAAFVGTVVLATTVAIGSLASPSIPQCAEDVVLVGVGQYENGQWDGFVCGPALDDITQE